MTLTAGTQLPNQSAPPSDPPLWTFRLPVRGPNGQGGLHGEVPGSSGMNLGLSRAASLRTRRAPFGAPGSPAIYAACGTGFAWIQSWQGAQTMSVLRRIFAMRTAH